MTVITTGVTGGSLVSRQEIRNMLQDQDLFTLYILGLERFQKVDESDPLSWYQIAGIHGRPYVEYDPTPGSTNQAAGWPGYCQHSSLLFPIWHRPYLALFEQVLTKHVTDIANEYPAAVKQKYIIAAQKFRIPYWDWAYYSDPADVVTIQEQITVNAPTGIRTLDNPLYRYKFHPKSGVREFGPGLAGQTKYETWLSTVRSPTSQLPDANSRGDLVDASLHPQTGPIRLATYKLLLEVTNYGVFSNDRYPGPHTDPGTFQSIEAIHGNIHLSVGKGGHMSVSEFATFDPIFWLHHANVDRVFTIWQALHPKSYVDTSVVQKSIGGTFTMKNDDPENVDTHLTPFRSTTGYWTSATARDTRTFNYTYPELAKWASFTEDQKAENLTKDIRTLYGNSIISQVGAGLFNNATPSVPLASKDAPSHFTMSKMAVTSVQEPQPSTSHVAAAVITPPLAQRVSAPQAVMSAPAHEAPAPKQSTNAPAPITQYNEWTANIVVEKYAAKTSFSVHIFLGDFDSDPAKWAFDKNLVGSYSIFTNNIETTGCARCRTGAEAAMQVTGTVPLTEALMARLGQAKPDALQPAEVIPYLTKEMHWRIQTADNAPIERADMPSLKVSVMHVPVSLPSTISEKPTWGEATNHAAVTTGRPGGASEAD